MPGTACLRNFQREQQVPATNVLRLALLCIATIVLLAPAIWNGFPFIFADTGGYLDRPFEQTLEFGRSAFYGAFLAAGISLEFWPNVMVQAALTVWVLALTLRVHGLATRAVALPILAGLAFA